jgi:hypothetical protein
MAFGFVCIMFFVVLALVVPWLAPAGTCTAMLKVCRAGGDREVHGDDGDSDGEDDHGGCHLQSQEHQNSVRMVLEFC